MINTYCSSTLQGLFYNDQEFALHTLPKLSLYHIVLTSYSKMKVKLATQVLSRSVAIALEESGKEDITGTAQICRMMNDFFDCTNVRSLTEHLRKKEIISSNLMYHATGGRIFSRRSREDVPFSSNPQKFEDFNFFPY